MLNYIRNNKLGATTMALSLVFIFLGLPSQIATIWSTRSVAGVSPLMFSLLAIQSAFWVAYGIQKRDPFMAVPNGLIVIFGTIIVIECMLFR